MLDVKGIYGNIETTGTATSLRNDKSEGNIIINGGTLVLTNNIVKGNVRTCSGMILEENGNTILGN